MLYIINKEVFFRDNDGTVWTGEENESTLINLTATTSRLLAYLLERQGIVSTRDDILETVWLSHGLRSSNHSLNKYVADLRKVFISMGIDTEVIVTIPTVGFMLTGNIEVKRKILNTDCRPSISVISDKNLPSNQNVSITKNAEKKIKNRHLTLIAAILCMCLLPAILRDEYLSEIQNRIRMYYHPENKEYHLGELSGCRVMTMTQNSMEMAEVKMRMADNIMRKANLQCIDNTNLFFQPSAPAVFGYTGRIFLSRCTFNKDDKEKFAACNSYYERNYSDED